MAQEAEIAAEALRKIEEQGKRGNWSGALCVGADLQLLVGGAGEVCLAVDSKGLGGPQVRRRTTDPVGASATAGVKGANTDIPGLGGGETTFGGEVRVGGAKAGVEAASATTAGVRGCVSRAGPGLGYSGYAGCGISASGYIVEWQEAFSPNRSLANSLFGFSLW